MNACAQIFEASGTGTVHVLLKVVGHPKDVVRESVVIVSFFLVLFFCAFVFKSGFLLMDGFELMV